MSAMPRKRPNRCIAAMRRLVPKPDSSTAAKPVHLHLSEQCCASIGVHALDLPVERDRAAAPAHVAPEDVALAIAVEVAGLGNLPVRGYHAVSSSLQHVHTVQQPDPHCAARAVIPEDVALTVAVEVARAGDRPATEHPYRSSLQD